MKLKDTFLRFGCLSALSVVLAACYPGMREIENKAQYWDREIKTRLPIGSSEAKVLEIMSKIRPERPPSWNPAAERYELLLRVNEHGGVTFLMNMSERKTLTSIQVETGYSL
jgi:hypothetical protein